MMRKIESHSSDISMAGELEMAEFFSCAGDEGDEQQR